MLRKIGLLAATAATAVGLSSCATHHFVVHHYYPHRHVVVHHVVVTPLGMVVVFWSPGPMRTEADGPCAECLALDDRDRAAGWTVIR